MIIYASNSKVFFLFDLTLSDGCREKGLSKLVKSEEKKGKKISEWYSFFSKHSIAGLGNRTLGKMAHMNFPLPLRDPSGTSGTLKSGGPKYTESPIKRL